MSEHKHHHHPPESKMSLQRQFYKDDVRRWMYTHASKNSKKTMKEHTHRVFYKSLVRSLRNEEDPTSSAMMLIGTHKCLANPPENNDEESLAGEVVKQELEREFELSPSKKLLSAGLVLTERRRKMILDRLQGDGFQPDDPVLGDSELTLSTNSFGTSTASRFEVAIKTSEQGRFQPKWEHYETMRTRYRFLRPQAQNLVNYDEMIAPTTKTHVMRSAKGEKIQGNFVEIEDFNRKQQQQSPGLMKTTGALQDRRHGRR